jgi:acyl-CoA synthetase (AMP-forming)/AMP-acid ligase II
MPALPASIPRLVRTRGTGEGSGRVYLRLVDRTTETRASATYAELYRRSCAAALDLVQSGVRPGDRVMLLMETRLEFYYALFGAMRLGALPVAVYPPLGVDALPAALAHLSLVAETLDARAIACSQPLYGVALRARGRRRTALVTFESVGEADESNLPPEPPLEGPVLLQYTSGSLGAPRAIELRTPSIHANLLAIGDAFDMREGDVGFSWLPLYHDMGLHSIFFGLMFQMPMIYMSPIEFLKRPASWLMSVGRYKVTHSPAPNFGYSFAARRAKDADLAGVDLSSWRVAMCGAEPIDAAVLGRFADRFERYGFRRSSFMAAYGLAENTVAVSFAAPESGLSAKKLDPTALFSKGVAERSEAPNAVTIVSVGAPIAGHDVRIVADDGAEVPDGHVGEIQVRGPSRMSGYREDPGATAAALDGEWLRTGDLGFVEGGEIHITGRKKDLIIRGGHNYYPQDIEAAATVFGVRPGCVIAFGRRDPKTGTEDVIVVAEAKRPKNGPRGGDHALAERVRAAVHAAMGVQVTHVEIVEGGTVPKTTSGKLKRRECKERFEAGTLRPPKRPEWHLLARVGAFNLLPARAQRWIDRARLFVEEKLDPRRR